MFAMFSRILKLFVRKDFRHGGSFLARRWLGRVTNAFIIQKKGGQVQIFAKKQGFLAVCFV